MKLLVSCDEYCFKCGDNYYMKQTGSILIQRYLSAFDSIKMVIRQKEIAPKEITSLKLIKVTNDKVEFIAVPFFKVLFNILKKSSWLEKR